MCQYGLNTLNRAFSVLDIQMGLRYSRQPLAGGYQGSDYIGAGSQLPVKSAAPTDIERGRNRTLRKDQPHQGNDKQLS